MARQNWWALASSMSRLRDHRHTTLATNTLDEWLACRRNLYLTSFTQQSLAKDICAPGGIRTRNLSKRANADARLGPRYHRDGESSLSGSYTMHTQAYRKWANYWSLCLLDRASSSLLNKERPTWCHLLYYFIITQNVSDVNASILRSLRLICWVISWVVLLWFGVCWCYVVVWLWWCGIRMPALACKPQRYTNTQRTRAIQPVK